jgi:hypothetical protein
LEKTRLSLRFENPRLYQSQDLEQEVNPRDWYESLRMAWQEGYKKRGKENDVSLHGG